MPLEKSILNKENIKQLLLERYGLHYLEDNHLSQGTANCFRIRYKWKTGTNYYSLHSGVRRFVVRYMGDFVKYLTHY